MKKIIKSLGKVLADPTHRLIVTSIIGAVAAKVIKNKIGANTISTALDTVIEEVVQPK